MELAVYREGESSGARTGETPHELMLPAAPPVGASCVGALRRVNSSLYTASAAEKQQRGDGGKRQSEPIGLRNPEHHVVERAEVGASDRVNEEFDGLDHVLGGGEAECCVSRSCRDAAQVVSRLSENLESQCAEVYLVVDGHRLCEEAA